jgi:hypothetical protein
MAETLSKVEQARRKHSPKRKKRKKRRKQRRKQTKSAFQLEKQAKGMDAKTLRAYFVENELKKRPTRATAGVVRRSQRKCQCACAHMGGCNTEKEKIGKSGWNDVKQCCGNAGAHEGNTARSGSKSVWCARSTTQN